LPYLRARWLFSRLTRPYRSWGSENVVQALAKRLAGDRRRIIQDGDRGFGTQAEFAAGNDYADKRSDSQSEALPAG
jgi:hypothetical protein